MENLIIIGSGPAGHTASIYSARANLNPIMFEGFMAGGMAAGGQLTTTNIVENYPGFIAINGTELMYKMREQSLKNGTIIHTKTVDKVDFSNKPFKVFVENEIYETNSIIIATGATAKRMNLPGEDKYWQRGVSACAVCDGGLPIFRDQQIAIVGGGDSAIEEAMHLTKFASKVIMLVRRDVFRASKIMQQRAFENKKIEIMWNTNALELKGDDFLQEIIIKNNKTNEKSNLKVKGLFYAIGHKPNTDFLKGQIELDNSGYIITKPGTTQTNIPGVFAAGDVQDKIYRQAITSAGTGCMAALDAEKYLQTIK